MAFELSDGTVAQDTTISGKKSGSVTTLTLANRFKAIAGRMPTQKELSSMQANFSETYRLEQSTIDGVVNAYGNQAVSNDKKIAASLETSTGKEPTPEEIQDYADKFNIDATTSPEELLRIKGEDAIDRLIAGIESQAEINKDQANILAVSSGLYDPIYDDAGNLVDIKLNQETLDNLRGQISAQNKIIDKQLELADLELTLAKDLAPAQAILLEEQITAAKERAKADAASAIFSANQTRMLEEQAPLQREILEKNLEVTRQQFERYTLALEGKLPISEGTRQRKAQEFELFKEAQARAGNPIEGDTPETATASSTPGVQSLEGFRKKWALTEEAERRGELDRGLPAFTGLYNVPQGNTQAPGFGANIPGMSPTFGLTGQAVGYGPLALAGTTGNVSTLTGQSQQPYQFYAGLDFQKQAQQPQGSAAFSTIAGGLQGGAAGGMAAGPWGALAGALAGAAGSYADYRSKNG